ncbi:MAG: oligosaccharide flippase family protein [Chromatiaceae bacterium]|jgi:PST family polysaccharide transporter|nr:oligosaccharide flippase family protein [Chromatiaceae bacterium]
MPPDQASKSLSGSVAAGAVWLAGGRFLVRSIGLISTIILARLLLPEDFGLVALATALLFVLDTLSDLRFEQAIIAQRDTRAADLNTAWTLNLLRGAGLALVLAAAAYPYASVMGDPRLIDLLLLLALLPLLDGLKNPAFVTFEKSMVFHREFALQLAQKITAFCVTVTLAWLIRSYWALVAGMLTGNAVRVLASYQMHPFRPRPALAGWRRLVAFSGWLMGANVLHAAMQKAEFFLIGVFLPVRVAGLFQVGSDVSNMASNEAVIPIKRALFPAFSSLAHDPQRQYQGFRRAMEVITALALPLGVGLAVVADPFVLLALGDNWREAGLVISYLAPAAAIWAIAGLCDTLTVSSGQTRRVFIRALFVASYLIPAYVLGIWLGGLQGILIAAVFVALLSLLVNLDMVRRFSGRPLLLPLHGTWRSFAAALLMAAGVIGLRMHLAQPEHVAGQILHLAVLVGAGGLVYLLAHFALWQAASRPTGVERHVVQFIQARRRQRSPGTPS